MNRDARVRVDPTTGELEVEGSEEFVREMVDRFRPALREPSSRRKAHDPEHKGKAEEKPKARNSKASQGVPENFGEYLHAFELAKDQDRMLVAAHFVQVQSDDNSFKTAEANTQLTEHGIKVGNPSQAVKGNISSKYIFKIERGKYRVAKPGIARLEELKVG